MAHTDIENCNGRVIRKLHSPDGKRVFGYVTFPIGYDGTDISKVTDHTTLGDARDACGFEAKLPAFITAPKSSYAQNQKNYRADSAKGKKAA